MVSTFLYGVRYTAVVRAEAVNLRPV